MKSKILIKKYKIPTFNYQLQVIISPSLQQAINLVEDRTHVKIPADGIAATSAFAYFYSDEKNRAVFMLFLRPTSKPGEIAHEAKHLVNFVFSYAGVRLSLTNDESECYFLGRIVDMVHNTINNYKKLYIKTRRDNKLIDKLLNSIHNN